jgi:signal transduction histidine kinase
MPATALLCSVAMVTAHSAYVDVTESVRLAALVQHSTDGLAVGLSGGADTGHKGEPVDLDVSDVVTAVAERRRSSGQVVRVRGGVGRVHAHPAELAVAVDKLLVNAETYAPGSPVTLQVLAIGARVEISVSDRGPGLSADAAERAFAPRAERPTGLGLHVARSLVVANGGELELRNRIGGATFVISLPAVRPTDAQPAHLQQVPPAGAERRRRPARDVSSHAV